MFDVKKFKATPGMARRLVAFSELNGMQLSDDVRALAQQDLISLDQLNGSNLNLDDTDLKALQHVTDWNNRAMILDSGDYRARRVALASAWIRPKSQTLILAKPQHYAEWVTLIKESWPQASISVFGNPRYQVKGTVYPDGVEFSTSPDHTADFLVTSYGSVIWNGLLSKTIPALTIVEELDSNGSAHYTWQNAIEGLFIELPAVIFIQNINNLPSSPGSSVLASLQTHGGVASSFVFNLVSNYLWCGNKTPNAFGSSSQNGLSTYLSARGYSGVDNFKIFPIFGISTHLILDSKAATRPLDFYDQTIKDLRSNSRKDSGLVRLIHRERDLEARAGQSIKNIVQDAFNGDDAARALIGQIKTQQWATLKAQAIKRVLDQVSTRITRTLVVAQNSDLIRALHLQLCTYNGDMRRIHANDLTSSPNREKLIRRYIHPTPGGSTDEMEASQTVSVLIVKPTDLDNADLLLHTNFVMLAEYPADKFTYQVIKEDYVDRCGARLIQCTLRGTFEEEYHNLISKL